MNPINKIKALLFPRHREREALDLVSPYDRILKIGACRVSVGKYTYGVGNIFLIHHPGCPPLSIGRYCSIAQNVRIILGAYHRHDWVSTYPFSSPHQNINKMFGMPDTPGFPKSKGPIEIGNDVWIGDSATIMSGITIGDGAVIAAGAHVVKDVAPYEMVGGNPAKNIGYRFNQNIIERLLHIRWWNLPDETIKGLVSQLSAPPSEHLITELEAMREQSAYGAP